MASYSLFASIAAVLVTIVSCQPSEPFSGYSASDCREGLYFADQQNLCWYHECIREVTEAGSIQFKLLARDCPLGTRLPYSYFADWTIPCSVNLEGDGDWECSRERPLDTEDPPCATEMVCENDGRLRHRHGVCWCDCPRDWQGGHLCEKPTGDDPHTSLPDDCPAELMNNCTPGLCKNDGVCHSECGGYWCECPTPFRWGRHCEEFSCDDNNECYNGGTCDRGASGNREYRSCTCPPGFIGRQCEIEK